MKLAVMTAMVIILVSLATPLAFANGAGYEWANLNRNAEELHRIGNFELAEAIAKKALGLAERNVGPNHRDVATSLDTLSAVYRSTDRDGEAEVLEERAAGIRADKKAR